MGSVKYEHDLDLGGVAKLIRALHNPVSSDPSSPQDGEMWLNTTSDVIKAQINGTTQTLATMADVTAGGISASLFNAFSILAADTDNDPQPLTVAASTVVGRRASGGIVAVTYANLIADLEAIGLDADSLSGEELADILDRANHTGSQASSTISDFATAVGTIVDAAIADLVDSSPGTLDTLNELAAALGDDPNFATTTATALGLKTENYNATFGNGSAQSFNFSHGLATTHVIVQCFVVSTGAKIECGVTITDANTVNVTTVSVPTTNQYRVEIVGTNS